MGAPFETRKQLKLKLASLYPISKKASLLLQDGSNRYMPGDFPKPKEQIFDGVIAGDGSPVILDTEKGSTVVAFNIDGEISIEDARTVLGRLIAILNASGITTTFPQTSGKRGFHLLLFLDRAVKLEQIYGFCDDVIEFVRPIRDVNITFLPSTSQALRVIYSVHQASGNRSLPLDCHLQPISDELQAAQEILAIKKTPAPSLGVARAHLGYMKKWIPRENQNEDTYDRLKTCKVMESLHEKLVTESTVSTTEVDLFVQITQQAGLQKIAGPLLAGLPEMNQYKVDERYETCSLTRVAPSCAALSCSTQLCRGTCSVIGSATSPVFLADPRFNEKMNLPEGVLIPSRYRISNRGIEEIEKKANGEEIPHTICLTPAWIARKTKNIETSRVGSQLEFLYDGLIKKITVPQGQLASAHELVDLADFGIAANTNNAAALVNYFDEQRHASLPTLPELRTCSSSGWISGDIGRRIFVYGDSVVHEDPLVVIEREVLPSQTRIMAAMRPAGSSDCWVDWVKKIREFPIALFILGAGFAAPLLDPIDSANFTINVWGHSTGGKTTLLKLALSIYGCPTKDGLLLTWKATIVGIEGRASLFNGITMPLDDNSQADGDRSIQDTTYAIGNGTTKTRGGRTGEARNTPSFSIIGLSTGERPCATSSSLMGQAVRLIEIGEPPFGTQSPETGLFVRELNDILDRNYGHAAKPYLSQIVSIANTPSKLNQLREEFQSIRKNLSMGVDDPFVIRVINHLASVQLGLRLTQRFLPQLEITDGQIEKAIQSVLDLQKKQLGQKSNIDVKALAYIWQRILTESARFDQNEKVIERWGKKIIRRDLKLQGYAILPTKLEKILQEGDFNPSSCMSFFRSNKWVWLEEDKQQLWPVSFADGTTRCYVFDKQIAIDQGALTTLDVARSANESDAPNEIA